METAEALTWRKSSYSTSNGGNCVEVATTPHTVAVRDSKSSSDAILRFARSSWRAFISHAKAGYGLSELDVDGSRPANDLSVLCSSPRDRSDHSRYGPWLAAAFAVNQALTH